MARGERDILEHAASRLLKVKADLECELEVGAKLHEVRPRRALGRRSGVSPGHSAHRQPGPQGEPTEG